ncbi:MAG: type II toxin-antitoxin system prevent-host-death family antitoxin [Gemmatimonadota bacterium]|nr:type II toxin-antitoxin system prevent-host-death family antitoxin [Gemmatimonadota bacterium]
MVQTTYSNARANLAEYLKLVTSNNEVVVITRRGSMPVAMISESELRSLEETAHLLRLPKNAKRLIDAISRAADNTVEPGSLDELRSEVGLE